MTEKAIPTVRPLSEILPPKGGKYTYYAYYKIPDVTFYTQATRNLSQEEISGGNKTYERLVSLLSSWGMATDFDRTTYLPVIGKSDQHLFEPTALSKRVSLELLLDGKAVKVNHLFKIPIGEGRLELVGDKVQRVGNEPNYTDASDHFVLYDGQKYTPQDYQKNPEVQAEIRRLNKQAAAQFLQDNGITISVQRQPDSPNWQIQASGENWGKTLEYETGPIQELGDINSAYVDYEAYSEMGEPRNAKFYLVAIGQYLDSFQRHSLLMWQLSRTGAVQIKQYNTVPRGTLSLTRQPEVIAEKPYIPT